MPPFGGGCEGLKPDFVEWGDGRGSLMVTLMGSWMPCLMAYLVGTSDALPGCHPAWHPYHFRPFPLWRWVREGTGSAFAARLGHGFSNDLRERKVCCGSEPT